MINLLPLSGILPIFATCFRIKPISHY